MWLWFGMFPGSDSLPLIFRLQHIARVMIAFLTGFCGNDLPINRLHNNVPKQSSLKEM